MGVIRRSAEVLWRGDLRNGSGSITSESGVLEDTPYSFGTRFEQKHGTNPEELIASAHAACYSMALAHLLGSKGHPPEEISTKATCDLSSNEDGGFRITGLRLEVRAHVPGVTDASFDAFAREADANCPVSNLLREGARIELDATLV